MIEQHRTMLHNLRTASHYALSSWLGQFPWQWFGTFTFKHTQSQQSAIRKLNEYYFRLKRFAYRKPSLFWVTERGSENDRLHIHSLIRAQDTRQERIAGLWDHGRVEVLPFASGAVGYCCKGIELPETEWGILGTAKS